MSTSSVPSDAVASLVISLTEEERDYLRERVALAVSTARSNSVERPPIKNIDQDYWMHQYELGIRILTKLGA